MDSKKLLLLSDTHGSITALKAVLDWAKNHTPPNDSICAAAFLGDGISDLRPAADASGFFCEWKLVSGNNDFSFSLPDAAILEFGDHRFFMCHGHRYSLYGGYHMLIAAAHNAGAEAALFGHSHVPYLKNTDGVLLINPGSVGRPRSKIGATFAVIECTDGEPLKTEFWSIGAHGEIRGLKLS
jgi:putative phosphoesterase